MTVAATLDRNEVKAKVRSSRVLTADLKRYWLGVLPHLTDQDCARLLEVLDEEGAASGLRQLSVRLRGKAGA